MREGRFDRLGRPVVDDDQLEIGRVGEHARDRLMEPVQSRLPRAHHDGYERQLCHAPPSQTFRRNRKSESCRMISIRGTSSG